MDEISPGAGRLVLGFPAELPGRIASQSRSGAAGAGGEMASGRAVVEVRGSGTGCRRLRWFGDRRVAAASGGGAPVTGPLSAPVRSGVGGSMLGTKSRWRTSASEPSAPMAATTVEMAMRWLKVLAKADW